MNSTKNLKLKIHPLPLFGILDHHSRRPNNNTNARVIGTLLGRVNTKSDTIEITNSFAVPHLEEEGGVAVGKDFHKQMVALQRGAPEVVVGWYGTGGLMTDTSSLVHEYYAEECPTDNCIHLVVDTSLSQDNVKIQAFTSVPVNYKNVTLGTNFVEVPYEITTSSESERVLVNQMIRGVMVDGGDGTVQCMNGNSNTKKNLKDNCELLLQHLENVSTYVDGVVAENCETKCAEEERMGKRIHDALLLSSQASKTNNNSMSNDLLMVSYLSQMTKTQLVIAEKLNESLKL